MKLGRNELCACGSQKKYKRCCGRGAVRVSDPTPMFAALAVARRYEDMEASARVLVDAEPRSGPGWKALSYALDMQGKDALAALARAAGLLPDDAEVHNNWGAALRRAGQPVEAADSLRRAIAIRPNVAEFHSNLGNALNDSGHFADAVEALQKSLLLNPRLARTHNILGNAFRELGRFEDSLESYRRALAIQTDYPEAHNNSAMVLRSLSRIDEAEASCRKALGILPEFPEALTLLAELHSDRGNFSDAEILFRRAIVNSPDMPEAWAGLAGLRRMTADDAPWLAQAQRIADGCSLPRQEIPLRYAIGKYFDDVADFESAFAHYRRANELKKAARPPHDARSIAHSVDQIVAAFDGEWLRRSADPANPSQRPVIVVGMPRSGTTLIEQILASHRDVAGAGELPFWREAVMAASGSADELGLDTVRRWGREYLCVLNGISHTAPRVVDKMPANFWYLGLIHAAFPHAKIIHVRRHPIDTCLSLYFQNFGLVHSYANDLQDLADYYREYRRIMAHWSVTLPRDALFEVTYEDLVSDPELRSREMLGFLGLSWDAACLDHHRTSRPVSTFSRWQARQKINRTSVGRWRHYERFLGPLRGLMSSTAPSAGE